MAEGITQPSQVVDNTVWVIAYMFDPRSERALRTLLDDTHWREQSAPERQRIVTSVRESGLTVVRLSTGRCDSWVYDAAKDDFAPLATIVAERPIVPTTATRQSAADTAD